MKSIIRTETVLDVVEQMTFIRRCCLGLGRIRLGEKSCSRAVVPWLDLGVEMEKMWD